MKVKYLWLKISGVLLFAAVALFVYFFDIGCVWVRFFDIECISCGLTRAWLSVFKGDISGAFKYHGMFWAIPVLVLYVFLDGRPFKSKYVNYGGLVLILLGFIVNYILKNIR